MTKTELKLIEKISKAKALLGRMGGVSHSNSCPVDADPDYYGPC